MLSVSIAVRTGGTIELQSGIYDDKEAAVLISSMTRSSQVEATDMIHETRRSGICRRRAENFEILTKIL